MLRGWWRARARRVHQRLDVWDGVGLVVVDGVKVHGNRKHEGGAVCAALTTDGLREGLQHEISWLVEYPFPKKGVIPKVVTNVLKYVREMNQKGVFVRPGDVLDVGEDTTISPFGTLPGEVKAIGFAPTPTHDKYWLGDHPHRLPPYPTLLATVLSPGERAVAGLTGGLTRILAAQMGYWHYTPCLPYIPHHRIPGVTKDLTTLSPAVGGDLCLYEGLSKAVQAPSPVRLNAATTTLKGNILTVTIPRGVGSLVHESLANTVALRTDEPVTLITDVSTATDGSLYIPLEGVEQVAGPISLDTPLVLPNDPATRRDQLTRETATYSASGVILRYFSDESHLDSLDVVDHTGAPMSDADACEVTLDPLQPDLLTVKLRHRSWLNLLESFKSGKGLLVPSADTNGVHFEVRWTSGQDIELYQQQAELSNDLFQKLREEGFSAFGEDAKTAEDSSENSESSGESDLLQVGNVLMGTGDVSKLSESQKQKVRIAGGAAALKESLTELQTPMSASQYEKYVAELNNHKVLADEIKKTMQERNSQSLEGNIIRLVWSYDTDKEGELERLQNELNEAEQAWAMWKTRLVSQTMHFLESVRGDVKTRRGEKPDIAPNLCIRVLCKEETGEPEVVYGVLIKDDLFPKDLTSDLLKAITSDEVLQDCPIPYSFDLFLNVASRGTYSRAKLRTRSWADLEKHYHDLSSAAASRLASLEVEHRKLAEAQPDKPNTVKESP